MKPMSYWNHPFIIFISHLAVWIGLTVLPFMMLDNPFIGYVHLWRWVLINALIAALYYLNYFVLVPRFLLRGRLGAFLTLIVLLLLAFTGLSFLIDFLSPIVIPAELTQALVQKGFPPEPPKFLFPRLIMPIMIFAISSGVRLTHEWFKNERSKKEMEHEKLKAELALLKWQVSPHFLFNTLNSIYSLAYKESRSSAPAIMNLSQMLRYMLYDSNVDSISLTKEVEHLQNYVDLQRMRLNDRIDIVFNIEGELIGKAIAPMLLIPIVENAFKHGVSYIDPSPIFIRLKLYNKNWLYLDVENKNYGMREDDAETSNGIGLVNIRRRLELLYPNNFELSAVENGQLFKTSLMVHI
ncbi:MAG: histidine kinase [Chitinophagales bacterium]|nr:histidine kinase [Chitinophagales bacterium]